MRKQHAQHTFVIRIYDAVAVCAVRERQCVLAVCEPAWMSLSISVPRHVYRSRRDSRLRTHIAHTHGHTHGTSTSVKNGGGDGTETHHKKKKWSIFGFSKLAATDRADVAIKQIKTHIAHALDIFSFNFLIYFFVFDIDILFIDFTQENLLTCGLLLVFRFYHCFLSPQIFHTVAIILLIISTGILLIGIIVRLINDQYLIRHESPFLASILGASVRDPFFLFFSSANCLPRNWLEFYFHRLPMYSTVCCISYQSNKCEQPARITDDGSIRANAISSPTKSMNNEHSIQSPAKHLPTGPNDNNNNSHTRSFARL